MATTQLGKANWQVGITDNVSRAVRQIRSNIEEGIGQAVRRFTDRIQGGLDAVGRRLQRLGAQFTSFGAKLGGIGLAIASPIFLSVRSFATLDDQLRLLSGITGALPRQFASVSARIRELGRTTSFTAAEVAAGAVALGRAGFDTSEIETSIGSILNLSRATGTELSESADIAGNTLRGFGLDVGKTGRVVDILTATANGSAQTLTDLSESMKLVAPIASQVGASIEETSASLGILANIGIKGSMAGTSLRQTFLQLAKSDTQETLKGIGVAVVDAVGEMRPLNDILSDIVKQSSGLSKVKRLDLFADLFDSRAAGAAAAVGASVEAVESFRKKLAEANGVAARTAAQMDAGVGGSFRRFLSAIEGISHAIGSSLEPSLKDLTDKFSVVAGRVTEFIGRNQGLVATIAAVVAGMIAAGAAITGVGLSLTVVGVGLRGVASSLGLITGPLNLAITGFRLLTTAAALSATKIVAVFRAMGAALLPIFAKIGLALAISLKSAASGVAAALLPVFAKLGAIAAINLQIAIGSVAAPIATALTSTILPAIALLGANIQIILGTAVGAVATFITSTLLPVFAAIAVQAQIAVGTVVGGIATALTGVAGLFSAPFAVVALKVVAIGAAIAAVVIVARKLFGSLTSLGSAVASSIGGVLSSLTSGVASTFNGMVSFISGKFSQLFAFAKTTFGAIANAIGSGNIQAAWDVVVSGLLLTWTKSVASLKEYWHSFVSGMVLVFETAVVNVRVAFEKMVGAVQGLLNGIINQFNNILPERFELPLINTADNAAEIKRLKDQLASTRDAIGENLAAQIKAAQAPARAAAKAYEEAVANANKLSKVSADSSNFAKDLGKQFDDLKLPEIELPKFELPELDTSPITNSIGTIPAAAKVARESLDFSGVSAFSAEGIASIAAALNSAGTAAANLPTTTTDVANVANLNTGAAEVAGAGVDLGTAVTGLTNVLRDLRGVVSNIGIADAQSLATGLMQVQDRVSASKLTKIEEAVRGIAPAVGDRIDQTFNDISIADSESNTRKPIA